MSIMGVQRGDQPRVAGGKGNVLLLGTVWLKFILTARVGWKQSTEPFHVAGSKDFCTEYMHRMRRSPSRL